MERCLALTAANGHRGAVFLDRDGVINRRRLDHVKSWAEFEFLPGVLESLAALSLTQMKVVVITNQAAVGRGLMDEATLQAIHERMVSAIGAAGGRIAAVYACIHRPEDGCGCRKPHTELFLRAAKELGIDLSESVVIGDAPSDIQAAVSLGCPAVLIGTDQIVLEQTVPVVTDLATAVSLFIDSRSVLAC